MTTQVAPRVSVGVGAVLALAGAEDVGPLAVRELVDRAGDPLAALAAAPGAPELSGKGRAALRALLSGREPAAVARRAAADAARRLGPDDRLLGYGAPGYPHRLGRLHFPPPLLWVRGPLPADAPRAVAIVGTRRATQPARDLAHELAAGLAAQGVRIVSGLAAGIDGAAHRGALAAHGDTVGVLGSGLRYRYPRVNHDLYARLQAEGLLLTEFAPDVRAESHNFPRRNRIVAALCDAVVVVQAPERSGALLTADEAKEIGVEVMAVPGDPRLAASVGGHGLLRDGASLVTTAAEVLEELGWTRPDGAVRGNANVSSSGAGGARATPHGAAAVLLGRLDQGPAALDELAALAGDVRAATALLARLELAGEVTGRPGGRYERGRRSG